jgi:hypothetical protein
LWLWVLLLRQQVDSTLLWLVADVRLQYLCLCRCIASDVRQAAQQVWPADAASAAELLVGT